MATTGSGSFDNTESNPKKRRKPNQPPAPVDIADIVRLIADYPQYKNTSRNEGFYRHHNSLTDGTGEYLIFVSPELQHLLQSETDISVDASFKIVPRHFSQLLTVHVYVEHRKNHVCAYQSLPVVYVLMTSDTKESYAAIFEYLATTYNMRPETVITDFEDKLQDSLKQTFPKAKVVGSWFHYGQSIWNHVKQFGLQNYYTVPIVKKFIGMVLSLPFLSWSAIEEGLSQMPDLVVMDHPPLAIQTRVAEMLDWVHSYWICHVGPKNMSVYPRHHQTYNDHEMLHDKLGQRLAQNVSVWVFIEEMLSVNDAAYSDYSSLRNGQQVSIAGQKCMARDSHIDAASRMLRDERCTILEFLEATARSFYNFLDTKMQETDIVIPASTNAVPVQAESQDNPPALTPA